MRKRSRLAASIMAMTLAGAIEALAAQNNTDQPSSDNAPTPIAPEQQWSLTESPTPVATAPREMQIPSQPVAVENVLGKMKIYPSF